MELVYLWVEDYKNIHRQGFNFSPKFTCDYNDETNKLTIDKNDDHIENFFGDNINVTAIVGKNGSGKSSIIEFILDRLASRYDIYPENFIFIYSYENKLYKYSNCGPLVNTKIAIYEYPNVNNFLKYNLELITLHINNEYKDVDVRDTQQIFSENNKYDKKSSNLVFVENYINNYEKLQKIDENIFTPDRLKISIKTGKYYYSILHDDRRHYSDEDWGNIVRLIESMKGKNFIDKLRIIKELFKVKYDKYNNRDALVLFDDSGRPEYKYYFHPELLREIPSIFETKNEDFEINISDINSSILEYIRKLPYIFEIDIFDKNNINIDSLSFGEKQLLTQLHYILLHTSTRSYQKYIPPNTYEDEDGNVHASGDYYEDNDFNKVLIFLDEFEIGLHPQWQKKTIKYIINFLKSLDIKIHLIFTTHSPFLLSDIPKQNIIFLDKDEDGKCIVVDGLKDKKQTFGANIHTLLSDSFFMEDGLMGEFAKGKINEIIEFHKEVEEENKKEKPNFNTLKERYKKVKTKFWDIQSIIGEDYLQQVVKNHLRDIESLLGYKEAREEEIKRLRDEADRLESLS